MTWRWRLPPLMAPAQGNPERGSRSPISATVPALKRLPWLTGGAMVVVAGLRVGVSVEET